MEKETKKMKLPKKTQRIIIALLCCFVSAAFVVGEEKEYIQKAVDLLEMQKYEKALEVIEAGLKKNGKTTGLINTKYKVLLAAKKYEEALSTFEEIIQRVGDSPEVMIDKIRLLKILERYDEALERFLLKNDIPWKIVFSGKGQEDEAVKLYKIDSVPKYLLIDKDGILRFSLDTGGENLEKAIRELLNE
jgi:tetratricopeptide (TPR) repeat protein